MFKLVNLKEDHLREVLKSPINADMRRIFTDEVIVHAPKLPYSVALLVRGHVMAVGGVNHHWDHRASIWALFNESSKHCFLPVFRGVKKWLDHLPYKRLEMDVPYGDKKILKRAKLWGFKVECERAKNFSVLGYDCTLLSRIR